jgi:hypothetical protein
MAMANIEAKMTARMAMVLYCLFRKAFAPSMMASAMLFISLVPLSCLSTSHAR